MAWLASSRTNSMWRSTMSAFCAITTPAPWLRPLSRLEASVKRSSSVPVWPSICRAIWLRSPSSTLPTSSMASTKNLRPCCVGCRPAEVCGAAISPKSSRSAMTLRTEAGLRPTASMRLRSREPTGAPVSR